MTDVDQLLVSNFIEALKQVHRYVVLWLGASASAFALRISEPTKDSQSKNDRVSSRSGHGGGLFLLLCA